MPSGAIDQPVYLIKTDKHRRRGNIHPASLAPEIAAVRDGDVQEWREGLTFLQPLLEALHRSYTLVAEVVPELPKQAGVGATPHPMGQRQNHLPRLGQADKLDAPFILTWWWTLTVVRLGTRPTSSWPGLWTLGIFLVVAGRW